MQNCLWGEALYINLYFRPAMSFEGNGFRHGCAFQPMPSAAAHPWFHAPLALRKSDWDIARKGCWALVWL